MNIKKWFEGDKIILHMFYIIVILVIFCIELFTVRGYSNEGLDAQLSLAGTLSGIILSVLAIMMTLFSELKSDNTKDTLERVSREIEKITDETLIDVSNKLEQVTKRIDKSTEKLEDASALNKKIDNVECNLNNILNNLLTNKKAQLSEEEKDLYSSYVDVFENYVDNAVDERANKCIYTILYYFIGCDNVKKYNVNKLIKILENTLDESNESIIQFSIGIATVFINYAEECEEFYKYLKEKLNKSIYIENFKEIDKLVEC